MPTVRTEPTHSAARPVEEPAAQAPLGPLQVRLSDGRIVTLEETTAADDARVEKILSHAGYTMQGMGVMSYARACALYSIKEIDGHKQRPIRTPAELDSMLMGFKTRDMNAVIAKYSEINGLAADDATFPGAGDGA